MPLDYLHLQQMLGVLTWPLLLCAFISLMIMLERLAIFFHSLKLSLQPANRQWLTELKYSKTKVNDDTKAALLLRLKDQDSLLALGAKRLLSCARHNKAQRDELLSLWLNQQQQQLQAGLKVLQVIGIVTPLLGLLGTVMGLIDKFAELGKAQGPVTPAQLSAGLGLAMNTTAAGLIIALPALTAAHLFGIWAQSQCAHVTHILNQLNLWLEGVDAISGNDSNEAVFVSHRSKDKASDSATPSQSMVTVLATQGKQHD